MKARKTIVQLFSALLVMTFFGQSCKKEAAEAQPLILGAIYDLTGPQSALDISSSRGAKLAVEEINRDGGIFGNDVQLILKDGKTDFGVLQTDVTEIMDQYPATAAFLGLSDSDQVLAAAEVAANNQRVFITSGATSPQLPAQIPDYLYLACFGDNVQAAAAAEWSYSDLGSRQVAIIYDSTQIYTRLLHNYFLDRFEQLGGQVLTVNGYGQTDLSQITNSIQGADLVFLASMPQNVMEGIQRVRQAGFSGPIIGGDSFDSNEIWNNQSGIGKVYFTTHAYLGADNPDPIVKSFRQDYMAAYGGEEPNAFAALGYDAVKILVVAARKAGSADPEKVRQALASLRDLQGVTGLISYGGNSRIPNKDVAIMAVDQNKPILEAQLAPQQVPAP